MKFSIKYLSIVIFLIIPLSLSAQKYDRGYDFSHQSTFLKKGTWMLGGSARYSIHDMDNYSFLMMNDVNSMGYNLLVSPAFCYMRKDNLGIGMRMEYGRNMTKIDDASAEIAGLEFSLDDYHSINHSFKTKAILRNYIPLGDSKIFALVNETQLSLGWGQSKIACRKDPGVKGTYSQTSSIGLNICPGMMAFATERLAIEFSVNMLGLQFSRTAQVHNQVFTGNMKSTSVNFKVNILSIGFGLYYYL